MSSAKDLSATSFRLSDFVQTQPKGQIRQEQNAQPSERETISSEHEKNIQWLLCWAY